MIWYGYIILRYHPEAEEVQICIWRSMPAWRKLELAAQMTATVRALLLAGLTKRYPTDSAAQLQRRFTGL